MSIWVYDLEVLGNFFSGTFLNPTTKEVRVYVIHHTRDDRKELLAFLNDKSLVKGLIGFNNLNYDYPMLHYLLTYKKIETVDVNKLVSDIYNKSQEIIGSEYSAIKKPLIKQLDLYKLKHFDNDAKRTSLKWLEFAMNWENVQDMPLHYTHHVQKHEVDLILDYNLNDVKATNEFYKKCKGDIELRKELSKTYNIDLTNANEPKIGSEIFALELSKDMDVPVKDLKQMRTERPEICLKDCILPYIEFKSKEFNALLDFLKDQCIKETKGFFTDLPIKDCSKIISYVNKDTIKKHKLEALNIRFKNEDFYYGTGGIHQACKSGIYTSDENWIIVSGDVESYYPNLSINNGFRPEHLGDSFTKIYKSIFTKRKATVKGSALNAAYKLMLNGSLMIKLDVFIVNLYICINKINN